MSNRNSELYPKCRSFTATKISEEIFVDNLLDICGINRIVLGFVSGNQVDSGNDSVTCISVEFVEGFGAVGRSIHHSEMLPVNDFSGLRVTNCKVRVETHILEFQGTLIAKRNFVGEKYIGDDDF